MDIEVEILRSSRRTLSIQIDPEGKLIARAPLKMPKAHILEFIEQKSDWINKHLKKVNERREMAESLPPFTLEEIREMARKAVVYIPERVRFYAPLVGVGYGRITVRNQKSRWGSCSAKGNLNFNCLLMQTPPEVIDSVVVHELCHRLEPNHSPRFYAEVLRVFPDYYRWDAWLKENGPLLIKRMTDGLSKDFDPDEG